MAKKEFTYRGKTMEELKQLDIREFAKLTRANNRRSILRNFNEMEKFVNRSKVKMAKKKQIKTHDRYMVIVPGMIGMKIGIYDGQKFVFIEMVGEMLGHRLGEFAPTRTRTKHGKAGVGSTKGTRSKAKK
jgi:small subunit ribosomal protein S19